MITSILSCINNSLLYMQKNYKATSIGFFRAKVVNLQPVAITREMHFKQHNNKGVCANEIKVKNAKGEFLGKVEYKIRNILEPMMKHCNWTMLLNVEFDHMNVNNILCVKVEVLLWNKVGVEDVVNAIQFDLSRRSKLYVTSYGNFSRTKKEIA